MISTGIGHSGNLDLLDAKRDDDLVSCFESYSESGFTYISQLLAEHPGDISGVETLIMQIISLVGSVDQAKGSDPHKVEF